MKIKVGVVQETPVFFDLEATMHKMEGLVREAAGRGCRLVVFPESFIPGYPRRFTFGATVGARSDEGRQLYRRYWENSITVPGPALAQLERMAREHGVFLVTGVTERDAVNGSLYCTMLYLSPTHGYLGKHRKIKPTGVERLVRAMIVEGAHIFVEDVTLAGVRQAVLAYQKTDLKSKLAKYTVIKPTASSRAGPRPGCARITGTGTSNISCRRLGAPCWSFR
jgi:predicted amidohydrolase